MNQVTRDTIHPLFPNMPVKPSYRIREVARWTGFSRRAIHEAIDRGELQVLKLSQRRFHIPLASLRDYLHKQYYDPFA